MLYFLRCGFFSCASGGLLDSWSVGRCKICMYICEWGGSLGGGCVFLFPARALKARFFCEGPGMDGDLTE